MTSLFSTPKTPTLPKIKEPDPMPDSEAAAEAKRKKLAARSAQSGRESTFLSEGSKSDTLGG